MLASLALQITTDCLLSGFLQFREPIPELIALFRQGPPPLRQNDAVTLPAKITSIRVLCVC